MYVIKCEYKTNYGLWYLTYTLSDSHGWCLSTNYALKFKYLREAKAFWFAMKDRLSIGSSDDVNPTYYFAENTKNNKTHNLL